MSKRTKDMILHACLIVFGIATYLIANQYKNSSTFDADLSSAFLPQLCSALIVLISLIGLTKALLNRSDAYRKKIPFTVESKIDTLRGVGSIALMTFYVLTFTHLGFIVSSVIYLFVQQLILTTAGNRHWVRNAILSVGLPVACYFVFVEMLNYMLPAGILK